MSITPFPATPPVPPERSAGADWTAGPPPPAAPPYMPPAGAAEAPRAAHEQMPPAGAYAPAGPYAGPPMGPGQPAWGTPQPVQSEGFLSKLFDLSFSSFVTPTIARIVFVCVIVLSCLAWLVFVIVAFMASIGMGLVVLLLGWIIPFLIILSTRMSIEFYLAVIKTAENTAHLVKPQP